MISYCDRAKFSGSVYEKLRMGLSHATQPSKVWSYNTAHITDNLLRQKGYDVLFGTSYGKNISNEDLIIMHGWFCVYDCGQKVYTYQRNQTE